MGKAAYIDGDVLKYLAGFAVQKTIYTHLPSAEWFEGKTSANEYLKEQGLDPRKDWVDSEWTSELQLEPFTNCRHIIEAKIGEILHECSASEPVICLTPSTTFRHEVAFTRPYKGNRVDSPKPEYSDKIIEYFHKEYHTVITEGLEADDIMGMNSAGNVIATNDKDLDMVPGEHFNFSTGERFWVDPIGADEFFYTQLLAGDPTDNIQGIPGMGMKKAKSVVESYDIFIPEERAELIQTIYCDYEDHYPGAGQEVMEEHAALVYILRPGDTISTESWRKLICLPEETNATTP